VQRAKDLKTRLPEAKERERVALETRDEKLAIVGNLVHQAVPVSIAVEDKTV
jgi:hypothetical protein